MTSVNPHQHASTFDLSFFALVIKGQNSFILEKQKLVLFFKKKKRDIFASFVPSRRNVEIK